MPIRKFLTQWDDYTWAFLLTIKNRLITHEIEHEENLTKWDAFNCEIP
jgi:hypothetical protein